MLKREVLVITCIVGALTAVIVIGMSGSDKVRIKTITNPINVCVWASEPSSVCWATRLSEAAILPPTIVAWLQLARVCEPSSSFDEFVISGLFSSEDIDLMDR